MEAPNKACFQAESDHRKEQKAGWTLGTGRGMRPEGQLVWDGTCVRRERCPGGWEAETWPQSGHGHRQVCMLRRPPLAGTWSLAGQRGRRCRKTR